MTLNLNFKTHRWIAEHRDYEGDDCIIWPYSRARGYGHLKYGDKITYAHVLMCEMVNGPAPDPEHQASHSCGRGENGCVNPRHISWKTPSANMLDKHEHGTMRAGCGYRLDPEKVAQIRAQRDEATQDVLAARFGVSRRTIGAVLSGKTWPNGVYEPKGFAVTPYYRTRPCGQSTIPEK